MDSASLGLNDGNEVVEDEAEAVEEDDEGNSRGAHPSVPAKGGVRFGVRKPAGQKRRVCWLAEGLHTFVLPTDGPKWPAKGLHMSLLREAGLWWLVGYSTRSLLAVQPVIRTMYRFTTSYRFQQGAASRLYRFRLRTTDITHHRKRTLGCYATHGHS